MSENQMSDLIRASVDGIREVAENEGFIGSPIETPSGITVIPVSKVFVAFATGGLDFIEKKGSAPANFGGGGGTGITVSPTAFLTVSREGDVRLISLETPKTQNAVTRIADAIENFPTVVGKIKDILSK